MNRHLLHVYNGLVGKDINYLEFRMIISKLVKCVRNKITCLPRYLKWNVSDMGSLLLSHKSLKNKKEIFQKKLQHLPALGRI